MHFTTALSLASITGLSLMPTAMADRWGVKKRCFLTGCTGLGDWKTDYESYEVLWKDGCQTRPGVPYMEWLCVDWKNARLSFKFEGQGQRCMRETVSETESCGLLTCSWLLYEERPCAWRMAAPEGIAGNYTAAEGTNGNSTESAAAETTPTVQARAFIA